MEENVVKKEKKNGWKIAFIVLVILIIVCVGSYFGYKAFIAKDANDSIKVEEDNNQDNKEQEQEELSYTDTSNYQYKLSIYKDSNGKYCYVKSNDCNKEAFSIPTETNDAKIYHLYTNFVIYNDNGIKVYEVLNNRLLLLDIDTSSDDYTLKINEDENEVYGVVYKKNNSSCYWNYQLRKLIYDDINGDIYVINNDYLSVHQGELEDNAMLMSTKENKILDQDSCVDYSINKVGTRSFIDKQYLCDNYDTYEIFNDEMKLIGKAQGDNSWGYFNDYLLVNENNIIKEYDITGKLVSSKDYYKVIDISDKGYIIYIDNDNYLYVEEFGSGFKRKLIKWDDNYYFHYMISGYYDYNSLSNENEKDAGMYLILQYDKSIDEGSGVEYYINVDTHEFREYQLDMIGGYAKPVLYLYPTKDTYVRVKFENEDLLTTTYPKFDKSWDVLAKPNGDLYDKDNNYYYGLYWEEDLNHLVSFDEGFYVEGSDAIGFLEEKLRFIGLNDRERNEAIMYWLPILESNKKNLVYFELTEERDSYNRLIISPKPDSILRVAIHVKKVNKRIDIKEEKLETFNRVGFSAVEWGGINYK